ncbi:MAG: hypothetical protein IPH75_14995 [bacterium]|nr:hypothetical protein [bacterium]
MHTESNSPSDRPGGEPRDQISFVQELWRKTTHLGGLTIPGGYYLLGLEKSTALWILLPFTVLVIATDISRFRGWWLWTGFFGKLFGRMIRSHEQHGDWTGASYVFLACCCTIALYSKPIAIAALAFVFLGDAVAALIGRRFGRHRFGSKSYEGSAACLVATLFIAWLVPGISFPVGAAGAVVATVIEAKPLGVDDNISVPILSGLVMTILQKML